MYKDFESVLEAVSRRVESKLKETLNIELQVETECCTTLPQQQVSQAWVTYLTNFDHLLFPRSCNCRCVSMVMSSHQGPRRVESENSGEHISGDFGWAYTSPQKFFSIQANKLSSRPEPTFASLVFSKVLVTSDTGTVRDNGAIVARASHHILAVSAP